MDPREYVEAVEGYRRQKDEAFRRDPRSPLPHPARATFQGLRYYPADPAWRIVARLVPHERPKEVVMQASDGAAKRYENVGHVEVRVPGASGPVRIQAYRDPHAHVHDHGHGHAHSEPLFIPFRDRTSGKETYGAGRYLDVHPLDPHEVEYEVDFNLAYNPFCAYDDAFSCPFPPPENWLQVEIRAGEKTFA